MSGTVYTTVRLSVDLFPALSDAVTVITFSPAARVMPVTLQLVVPEAVPDPPFEFAQVTWLTPTASDAVPPMLRLLDPVAKKASVVGELMLTTGAVVSGTVYTTVKLSVDLFPALSDAVTVITFSPEARVIPATLQLVVPEAVPDPPFEFVQVT